MVRSQHRRGGILGPTVDVLAAIIGASVVTYPVAATMLAVLDSPILTPGGLTLIVAVGAAYPVVAGPWSLGLLGDYVLVWTAGLLAIAAGAFPFAVMVGGVPHAVAPAVQVAILVLAHVVAAVAVGVYGVAPTRRL